MMRAAARRCASSRSANFLLWSECNARAALTPAPKRMSRMRVPHKPHGAGYATWVTRRTLRVGYRRYESGATLRVPDAIAR
eukprot:5322663-Prymnesium_polylepis.1